MAPGFTWAGDFRGRAGRRMAAGLCPAMPMASFGALDPLDKIVALILHKPWEYTGNIWEYYIYIYVHIIRSKYMYTNFHLQPTG